MDTKGRKLFRCIAGIMTAVVLMGSAYATTAMASGIGLIDAKDLLDIHAEASDSSEVVGQVMDEGHVAILGRADGWVQIQAGDIVGWVPEANLIETEVSNEEAVEANQEIIEEIAEDMEAALNAESAQETGSEEAQEGQGEQQTEEYGAKTDASGENGNGTETALTEEEMQAAQEAAEQFSREQEKAQRILEEQTRAFEEAQKLAAEQERAFEEAQRQTEKQEKALEEAQKLAEEQTRASEEAQKLAEEQARAFEEAQKLAEEQTRAFEEAQKLAKGQMTAAEKEQEQNAEAKKQAQEQAAAAEAKKQEQEQAAAEARRVQEEAQKLAAEQEKALAAAQKQAQEQARAAELAQQQALEQIEAASRETMESAGVSAEELELLASIIYCEAKGEPYIGKVAVGNVVMNRVRSSKYPNTIKDVIYAKGQFSPVKNGSMAKALRNDSADASCYQAALEALAGSSPVGDKLYFRRVNGRSGQVIGHHVFY